MSAHVQLGHLNYSNTLLDTNHSLHGLDTSFKLYHKHFQDLDIVHFQGWCTISSYTWSAQSWERYTALSAIHGYLGGGGQARSPFMDGPGMVQ